MATKRCAQCDGPLGAMGARGRTASYCSAACRQRAYRSRQPVPAELRRERRWVEWRTVVRNGRRTKMPLRTDGRAASSTDPSTWSSWTAVRSAPRRGYVLGEGIGCIDLDHCLRGGVPTPAAAAFLATVPDTYIEVSPSGDGLHVWGYLPEGPGRRFVTESGLCMEIYSVGRYITVTSQPFAGSVPRLADLTSLGLVVGLG